MITPTALVVNTTRSTIPVGHVQSEPLREAAPLGWMDNQHFISGFFVESAHNHCQ